MKIELVKKEFIQEQELWRGVYLVNGNRTTVFSKQEDDLDEKAQRIAEFTGTDEFKKIDEECDRIMAERKEYDLAHAIPYDDFLKLEFHPGWADGRKVCSWERFDAKLDSEKFLRAEVTWDDDCVSEGTTKVFNPQLRLESNRPVGELWVTYDEVWLELLPDEALTLIKNDPAEILVKYKDEIARLKLWSPE